MNVPLTDDCDGDHRGVSHCQLLGTEREASEVLESANHALHDVALPVPLRVEGELPARPVGAVCSLIVPFGGKIPEQTLWKIVAYVRSLTPVAEGATASTAAAGNTPGTTQAGAAAARGTAGPGGGRPGGSRP